MLLIEKEKSFNFSLSRITLYTQKIKFCMQKKLFVENVCLSTKFDLELKKPKKKFLGNFKITKKVFLYRHQRNAGHTISINGNGMISTFSRKKTSVFNHVTVLFVLNSRRN